MIFGLLLDLLSYPGRTLHELDLFLDGDGEERFSSSDSGVGKIEAVLKAAEFHHFVVVLPLLRFDVLLCLSGWLHYALSLATES